jgi:hypothetical protein
MELIRQFAEETRPRHAPARVRAPALRPLVPTRARLLSLGDVAGHVGIMSPRRPANTAVSPPRARAASDAV